MCSAISTTKAGMVVRPGHYLDWYPETLNNEMDVFQRILKRLAGTKRRSITRFAGFRNIANQIDRTIADLSEHNEKERCETLRQLQINLR